MLLTCNSCRNTYVIDDATIQASGGQVQCDQCQEPLVPLQSGAANPSTTVLDGYSFDNLESEWRKQQLGSTGAPGSPGDAEPAPPSYQGGGYGAAPPAYGAGAQPEYGHPQDPYAAPLSDPYGAHGASQGGYGAPAPAYAPANHYANPTGIPSGGYAAPEGAWAPPEAGGQPAPTQAMEPIPQPAPGQAPAYLAPAERTMAIDIDTMASQLDSGPVAAPAPAQPAPRATQTGSVRQEQVARAAPKQVIIGAAAPQHAERTAALDVSQIDQFMARQSGAALPQPSYPGMPGPTGYPGMPGPGGYPGMPLQPGMGQAKPKSRGFLIGIIALFVVVVVGGIVVAIVLVSATDEKKKDKASHNEVELNLGGASFEERLEEARGATTSLMLPPIEGAVASDGEILAVASEGVYHGVDLIISYSGGKPTPDQMESAPSYLTHLAPVVKGFSEELPIILLGDQSLTIEGVFPVIYTVIGSKRRVLIGGEYYAEPSSVGTIELLAYDWPAPPDGAIPPPKKTNLRVIIGDDGIIVQGTNVNPGGDDKNSIKIQKLPGAYDMRSLKKALADAKGATSDLTGARLVPEPGISYGSFVEVVAAVRGDDFNFPRFHELYLEMPR